jgi:hypothetical protein
MRSPGYVPGAPDLQPELGATRVEAKCHDVEMLTIDGGLELLSLRRFLYPRRFAGFTFALLVAIVTFLAF